MHASSHSIDTRDERWFVRRIRNVISFGGVALAGLLFAVHDSTDGLAEGLVLVFLFCSWAAYRLVRLYLSAEYRREAQVANEARLEGVSLTARTMRHHLANKLSVAVGYSEMLADDPRLPVELEEQAEMIRASAVAAVETVDMLRDRIVRVELDTSVAGPPLLDMAASTGGRSARRPLS
jgi:signal transduction histidine kinase